MIGTDRDRAELQPGMMVGEYRVAGVLGRGGMGKVYAAVHPVIGKRAAIKVLLPELSGDEEAVERFMLEARAVNQIGHPNIVDIFAFGELPDGRHYFVMELLRGESLRDRLQRGPLALGDAIALVHTIAFALEAAHDAGVIHRDLKPDNVFLVALKGNRSLVKLLDFGIAKLLGGQTGATRTQTGHLLGTPAYISPEQARGYAVDHRTDVYALGALAFEVCTGALVFEADNTADMIAKQLHLTPRRASSLAPNLPPELDELIARMLAKDAADRPTLPECRAVLESCQVNAAVSGSGEPPIVPFGSAAPERAFTPPSTVLSIAANVHTPPRTGRRARLAIVAGAVAAVVAIGIVLATRGSSVPPVVAPEAHVDAAVALPDTAPVAAAIDAEIDVPSPPADAARADARPMPIKKLPPKRTPPGTGSDHPEPARGSATGSDDRDAPM
jgi:serine/threonine protein kinase